PQPQPRRRAPGAGRRKPARAPVPTRQPTKCPRSFQLSTAGSPYAHPSTDSDVGLSRIRAPKDTGSPSHRAPIARRTCPWAKTSTSRSASRAHATTSSARAVTSATPSPSGAPSRQISQPGRTAWICSGVMPSYAP
ncbi:hypothetical protein SLI_3154, partial [Streptomyces lividans 1326]